jgi:hypothetical protein
LRYIWVLGVEVEPTVDIEDFCTSFEISVGEEEAEED